MTTTTFNVTNGINGLSAYEVAVANGFVGTQAAWLASLVGPQGIQGIQGVQGIQGLTGNGIASIVLTSTVGLTKTYTITFTDTTTTTFSVTDGTNGTNGTNGIDGQDIDHVNKTAGTGAPGTTDTYTVWGNLGETINLGTFTVYNGANGTGTGDMLKATYDTTNNGIVDAAETVPWSGVSTTPTTLTGYGITDAATSTHNHTGVYAPVVHTHVSTDVSIASTNGAAHIVNSQVAMNHAWSAGITDGGAITNNGDGTISIAAGEAMLRASADPHTTLYAVGFAAQANITLTNNATNYVYLQWNAGVPNFAVSTSTTAFNCLDKCIAYTIAREGTKLYVIDAKEQNVDTGTKMRRLFLSFANFIHATGGSVLGASGLSVTVTPGIYGNSSTSSSI